MMEAVPLDDDDDGTTITTTAATTTTPNNNNNNNNDTRRSKRRRRPPLDTDKLLANNNSDDTTTATPNAATTGLSVATPSSSLWSGEYYEDELGDDEANERGPVCSCFGLGCINSSYCGCTTCARKDKTMISALTFIIILLVLAIVVTELAQVAALSKTGSTLENVVTATRNMIQLFRTSFSFLALGTLAMIGQVRTHDPDEEKQRIADQKTGKIVQIAFVVATVAGVACTVLSFGVYEQFMLHVVNKPKDEVDAGQVFLNWVAPSFVFFFQANVMQTFCMQTGYIGMVMIDSVVDLIVFTAMVLGWAANAPADQVVRRLGICNLVVVLVKWIIYFIFICRPSFIRRFDLTDTTIPAEMRAFVDRLGTDVLWQWGQNTSEALFNLCMLSFANQLGEIHALAYSAGVITIALLWVPSAVLSYYLTMFGSRFLGDKRYVGFWGLYRCTSIWLVILTAVAFVGYASVEKVAIDSVSYGENEAEVNDTFRTPRVAACVVIAMIFFNVATYYKGIFIALQRFKVVFIVYVCAQMFIGLPVAAVALARNSFTGLMLGAFLLPDFAMCVGFAGYWHRVVRPEQERLHTEHLEAVRLQKEEPEPDWMNLSEALGFPDVDELIDRGKRTLFMRQQRSASY